MSQPESVDNVERLRTDAMKAAEIRDELMPLLLQACEVFDRAKRDGLHVSLNLTLDQYGLRHVPNISVLKVL